MQLSGAAVFVSLLIGFIVGLLLFMMLTRRLQTLTQLMRSFSESQFTRHDLYTVDNRSDKHSDNRINSSGDEIDILGYHYNSMAERICE